VVFEFIIFGYKFLNKLVKIQRGSLKDLSGKLVKMKRIKG
jgi:hypothetical protein